ncbi:structure-specific endonuclease subunit SLX4 [Genypterus blacodes]|uniref:structure-specific endonuclease subunit SLX4 n=1 Tax=Genypterus blacodes TaxID=154954 RepID=UPI003F777448
MDDSDQDFVDLCSKLLKRVRRKAGEPEVQRTREHQPPSQACSDKRRKANKKDGDSGAKDAEPKQPVVGGGFGPGVGNAAERGLTAKDKVVHRMQEFRRVGPHRMAHRDGAQVTEGDHELPQGREASGLQSEPQDCDEALALQLQRELDRQAQPVEPEDVGLFFCQLCHKDLTHMTPDGRTQHLNRCLDQSEDGAPAPPPPPGVPDCPICGKRFTSQKSRAVHLKRCSSDMGVAPAVLLQALHRQTAEAHSVPAAAADQAVQPGGGKRKGPPEPGHPARKRPRKKTAPLDEDTMVALALSSSLLEQQRDREADGELQRDVSAPHASTALALMWKPDTGRGRGKRKKGAVPPPPPLLLLLDGDAALRRLQERVSALLLSARPPSPPTPGRSPSALPARTGSAPLWQKSALQDGGPDCPSHFQAAELREYFTPTLDVATLNKPDPSVRPAEKGAPTPAARSSAPPPSSQEAPSSSARSTWGAEPLSGGSQVLRDLMELGMSLSQCSYSPGDPAREERSLTGPQPDGLQPSGFVLDDPELCPSGFFPETECEDSQDGARRTSRRADEERDGHRSAALSRLTSDLSSMVNNPQLSDLQLQVDSGDLYFAHSFMVYARCPLLAQMVHEGGFWVREEGDPAVRRVLMNDVPGEAVLALLRYLYTATCSPSAWLTPHLLELASRFDLEELQQLCRLHPDQAADLPDQEQHDEEDRDRAFMELLRSMWNEDEEADDLTEGEEEVREERLTEEDLEEIYEFAATQRKREQESDSTEEEEEEEEKLHEKEDGELEMEKDQLFSKSTVKEPHRSSAGLQPDLRLDRSYSRLFSQSWGVYEEEDSSSSSSAGEKRSGRTLLQSSASVVDEPSVSHLPSTSVLPVPGLSPAEESDWAGGEDEGPAGVTKGRGSRGPGAVCVPLSPASPQQSSREPELIVLSDSSEETSVDLMLLSSCSPSPGSPPAPEPQPAPEPNELTPEEKECIITDSPPPGSGPDPSSAGCSPEVSWLIPSTPVQPGLRSGSTQTHSSMRRMQLFPRAGAPSLSSSSSSFAFSPPQLRVDKRIRSSSTPAQSFGPEGGMMEDSAALLPPSGPKLSVQSRSGPFLRPSDTPLLSKSRPYSSTPLHTEVPPAPLAASPLHAEPERTALGSLCLALSQSSSSSDRAPSISQSLCRASLQSGRSAESQSDDSTAGKRTERLGGEEGEMSGETAGGEVEEEEAAGSSLRQSVTALDEPPIAFNDSWGLDGCLEHQEHQDHQDHQDHQEDQVCFSLRLEDSRDTSQREPSSGHGQTASSSPSSSSSTSFPPFYLAGPPPPPDPPARTTPQISNSLLDSRLWDSWEEEEEGEAPPLPLPQRLNPPAQIQTPVSSGVSLLPVTPTPQYSDMDTPVLKDKLSRFGVRPLPKRQMILKLKEIHQYTHQLVSSDSEGEPPSAPPPSAAAAPRPAGTKSCSQALDFKLPAVISPVKRGGEDAELLSTSQGSNTSSTPASEDSERSNPELCPSDGDSDSDGGVSSSQAPSRLQDRLRAVRAFILSDAALYRQILRFRPLVLSQLQERLKAAGIRLGAAKLVDYLDSQCITFTTAKPGQRRRGRAKGGEEVVKKRRRKGGATAVQ